MAAAGISSDLTLNALKEPRVRDFVAGVEKSVARYGDTALTFLTNLQRADDAGAALGYVAAVAVEEKSIVDYNEGDPPATSRRRESTASRGCRWLRSTRRRER